MTSLKKYFVLVFLASFGFNLLGTVSKSVQGQDEFDQLFDEMLKDFFPRDLQNEIEKIRDNADSQGGR